MAALNAGELLTCCDGSYSPDSKQGSHGWVFTTAQTQLLTGAGPADGHPDLVSPSRAELAGLVAILHILH